MEHFEHLRQQEKALALPQEMNGKLPEFSLSTIEKIQSLLSQIQTYRQQCGDLLTNVLKIPREYGERLLHRMKEIARPGVEKTISSLLFLPTLAHADDNSTQFQQDQLLGVPDEKWSEEIIGGIAILMLLICLISSSQTKEEIQELTGDEELSTKTARITGVLSGVAGALGTILGYSLSAVTGSPPCETSLVGGCSGVLSYTLGHSFRIKNLKAEYDDSLQNLQGTLVGVSPELRGPIALLRSLDNAEEFQTALQNPIYIACLENSNTIHSFIVSYKSGFIDTETPIEFARENHKAFFEWLNGGNNSDALREEILRYLLHESPDSKELYQVLLRSYVGTQFSIRSIKPNARGEISAEFGEWIQKNKDLRQIRIILERLLINNQISVLGEHIAERKIALAEAPQREKMRAKIELHAAEKLHNEKASISLE